MVHEATKQYLTNLNSRLDTQTGSKNSTVQPQANHDNVVELFARFNALYKRLWSKEHDNEGDMKVSVVTWAEQLYGLTKDQVNHGFSLLPQHYRTFPPNAMQFADLCKMGKSNSAISITHQAQALMPPKADKKIARKTLAKCKRILKGDRNIDKVTV